MNLHFEFLSFEFDNAFEVFYVAALYNYVYLLTYLLTLYITLTADEGKNDTHLRNL